MAFSAHRPLIAVQNVAEAKADDKKEDAKVEQLALPFVFLAPIRPDIVHFVHTNMAKNRRQPYAVSEKAGHQHSAESWGTGRAVARVPRVSGGGTSRAGQGAFANMCRKGRMYAPTKIWRKWHRKINTNQKRFAVASALAASAVPALVMARGHKIDGVPEVPLVVDSSAEAVKKTKDAIKILKSVGAYSDVEKAHDSRKIRRGVGKMRNRRHVSRRGPLVVYAEDNGVTKAFRNLPGVELASVDRLNLLQLAPGGHLGRFIIWTRAAFAKLNKVYGTVSKPSEVKTGYTLPRNIMSNSDITRLINSDEVQSKLRPAIKTVKRAVRKKNPLTNLGAKIRLNPYALTLRRSEVVAEQRRATAKQAALAAAREKKAAPLSQDQKNVLAGTQREAAVARTHEPQQRENYKRLIQGEAYAAPVDKDGVPVPLTIQKPRASVKGVFPKVERKEKKPRKHKKVVEVEKKEAVPVVVAAKKLPKIAKEKKVKVKKEPKAKKEDKKAAGGKEEKGKAEAGKKEEAKKGGAAPKEEAKKAAGGKGGKK